MADYTELVKRLRDDNACISLKTLHDAADAIEELIAERDKYKRHSDSISELPDCNTCGKKIIGDCEFMPAYGDWVRINCVFWEPEPPEEES